MSIFKSKVLQVFFVGLVLPFAMLSTSVQAEKYPNGPVTMVVPWKPGGGTDRTARLFAPYLSKTLGVPVKVVNCLLYTSPSPRDQRG